MDGGLMDTILQLKKNRRKARENIEIIQLIK